MPIATRTHHKVIKELASHFDNYRILSMEEEYGTRTRTIGEIDLYMFANNFNLYCYEVKCNWTPKQYVKAMLQLNNHLIHFAKHKARFPHNYRDFYGYMAYRNNVQHSRNRSQMPNEPYDLAVTLMLYEKDGQTYQRVNNENIYIPISGLEKKLI